MVVLRWLSGAGTSQEVFSLIWRHSTAPSTLPAPRKPFLVDISSNFGPYIFLQHGSIRGVIHEKKEGTDPLKKRFKTA